MEYANDSINWACRDKEQRLYPERTWGKADFLFTPVETIQHPFLQKLIDYKGLLTNVQGEWTYMGCSTYVMFHVYDGFVNLECISTPVEERGKGSATKIMLAIVEAAKETNTEIRLRATNVTGHSWSGIMQHLVIATGINKKGKIPVGKLVKWYEKFGFTKVATCMFRGKKCGTNMVFKP